MAMVLATVLVYSAKKIPLRRALPVKWGANNNNETLLTHNIKGFSILKVVTPSQGYKLYGFVLAVTYTPVLQVAP